MITGMIDEYLTGIKLSFQSVPVGVYLCLILLFCLCTIWFLAHLGWQKGVRRSAGLLLLEYLILLLSWSVLTRNGQGVRKCALTPFWSYPAIRDGRLDIMMQVIMNVIAYVPVGFLIVCTCGQEKWWKVLLFGGVFSILIEALQFLFKCGLTEFDDVFHNVVGCLTGYGLYELIAWIVSFSSEKRASLS